MIYTELNFKLPHKKSNEDFWKGISIMMMIKRGEENSLKIFFENFYHFRICEKTVLFTPNTTFFRANFEYPRVFLFNSVLWKISFTI